MELLADGVEQRAGAGSLFQAGADFVAAGADAHPVGFLHQQMRVEIALKLVLARDWQAAESQSVGDVDVNAGPRHVAPQDGPSVGPADLGVVDRVLVATLAAHDGVLDQEDHQQQRHEAEDEKSAVLAEKLRHFARSKRPGCRPHAVWPRFTPGAAGNSE